MKVLMLGWEFPPIISGGLGTACHGLTKGLAALGAEIIFVLPRPIRSGLSSHVKLVGPGTGEDPIALAWSASSEFRRVTIRSLDVELCPYSSPVSGKVDVDKIEKADRCSGGTTPLSGRSSADLTSHLEAADFGETENYGKGLFGQVNKYAGLVCQMARRESFDVIHAHDWMTYPAAAVTAKLTGRPFIAHVHSTEFDRSGEKVNREIYEIERQGMQRADRIIAVSHLTKYVCTGRYGVSEKKIQVVHNAVDCSSVNGDRSTISKRDRIVLFLGRITFQKGPDYFLAAAKKVLQKMANVKFLVAGSGDMFNHMVELAAELGIGHKVLFTGFLQAQDVATVFKMADVYVMPSVSEPFGISALEAMANDVPVIISNRSGAAEVIRHALKVDFWDVDEMANKILSVLLRPALHTTLRDHGAMEVRKFGWIDSARKVMGIYKSATMAAA